MPARPATSLGHPITVVAPQARLAVWTRGSGLPIVFLHGGTGTAGHDWSRVVDELEDEAQLVAMDLRGHGKSTSLDMNMGITRFGLDTALIMRRLGIPKAILVGFSVGANSVLNLVARQPWLAHAAVVVGASSRGKPERVDEIMQGPWPRELRNLRHDGAGGSTEHWMLLRKNLAEDWAANVRFIDSGLEAITCPITVVHGLDDPIVLPEQARRLNGLLSNGRLVEVPGAGHQVHREKPDVFVDILRDTLSKVRAAVS